MHEFRIAYITPELCLNRGQEFIQGIHSETPFCLVAIDEKHIVFQDGDMTFVLSTGN